MAEGSIEMEQNKETTTFKSWYSTQIVVRLKPTPWINDIENNTQFRRDINGHNNRYWSVHEKGSEREGHYGYNRRK